jgi:Ca-activated chloride channel family protein
VPSINFQSFGFGEPLYLWLLVGPGVLAALWAWQVLRRRSAAGRYARERLLPVPQRYGITGELGFWFCLIVATALTIVALARPEARVTVTRLGGADFVILQDGSASMYIRDVPPDRWQRSIQFVRTFAETLNWKDDRVALALFAFHVAPQVRLTSDPNALFFFVEHLAEQSPFRLQDDPSWSTNIEEGIDWGLKIIDTNQELFGRSGKPTAFLVISDGQSWSGKVARILVETERRDIPVYVVGVGTAAGGIIPEPPGPSASLVPIRGTLDRESLRFIAQAGGGEYFEIGRQPDREIAARIITSVRKRGAMSRETETSQELYWQFLFAAGVILCAGTVLIRHRTEVWWHAAAAAAALLLLASAAA